MQYSIKKIGLAITVTSTILISSTVMSGDGHDHGHKDHNSQKSMSDHSGHDMSDSMNHSKSKMFLKKKKIDGYDVSFHVMKANDGMRHGGSHNFMVKVEKNGKTLKDVVINSKVIYPNKKAESKMLMKMGDWFMNGYDLDDKGKHQLMVLFKTNEGTKHKGGVYFSE